MTQSLSNLMNSPLALTALILWVILAFMAVRACRKWAKEKKVEKIIHQNHPTIPVKEYKLSDFVMAPEPTEKVVKKTPLLKLSTEQRSRSRPLRNAWDL